MKHGGKGLHLQLTRKAELALRVLRLLGGAERRTAGALAAEVGTTASYLPHVMAPLVTAGWVASGAGPRGGYRLAADLSGVSVLDVVEQVEGPTDLRCAVEAESAEPCEVHVAWAFARQALRDHLGSTPVVPVDRANGDLARPPGSPVGIVNEGT